MPEGFWEKKKKKEGKKRRRWPWVLGIIGGVLVLLVALAPTLAGWIAPGSIESAINRSISGTARVERVSLSWFGGQEVGPIVIRDAGGGGAAGQEVARVRVTIGTGLLGLVGGLDLGEIKVSGSARVVREKDGTLSTARVFTPRSPAPPPAPPAGGQTRLPASLKARLVLEDIEATYEDRGGEKPVAVRVGSVKGRGEFAVGAPLTLDLSAETWYGPGVSAATIPGGSVTLAAQVDGLTTTSGLVRPGAAVVDAKLSATNIASPMADALAGLKGKLAEAFGPAVSVTLTARGSAQDATAALVMTSPGASADAAVKYAKAGGSAVVSATRPATLRVRTAGFVGLAPGLAATLAARRDQIELTRWPEVDVTLASLRLPLPGGEKPLDLRGAAFAAQLRTTPVTGRVAAGGAGQPKQEFRVEPVTLSVTGELAGAVKVEGGTSVTVGGEPAGSLAVNMTAARVLDDHGGVRAGLPGSLSGSAALTKVTTSLAQPFLESAGVDLATDVGPTLDLTLAATTSGEGAAARTDLSLSLDSANLRAVAFAAAAGTRITARDKGLEVRAGDVGPLLERLGGSAGLTVDRGGAATVTAPAFAFDTAKIGAGDYRGVALSARVAAPGAGGTLVLRPGEPAQPWSLAPLTVSVESADLGGGVKVVAATGATLSEQPAGALDANLAVGGLLDAQGRLVSVPGSLDGSVNLKGASTAIAQPWVQAAGLNLPADIGPRVDLVLVAAGRAGAGASGPTTDVDVGLTSDKATLSAALTLDAGGVRGRDSAGKPALDISLKDAGAAVGRMLPPGGARLAPGGTVRVQATGVSVPLENGSPRLERAALAVTLSLAGFAADLPGASGRVEVSRLDAGATLAPATPAKVTLNSQMTRGSEPFAARAELSVAGLFGADGAFLPDPGAVRPMGHVELTAIPTALVSLGAPAETAALVQSALGPGVSVTFDSAKAATGDSLDLRASIESQGANVRLVAALASGRLDIGRLDGDAAVTPPLVDRVLAAYAPGTTPRPRLQAATKAQFALSPLRVPLTGLAPDFARAGDATVRLTLRDPLVLEGFAAAGQPGPGPAGVRGLEVLASLPLSAALGTAEGAGTLSIKGQLVGQAGAQPSGELLVSARTNLSSGVPKGPTEATVRVTQLTTAILDTLAGRPGIATGAVGAWVTLDGTLNGTFAGAGAVQDLAVRAAVSSPKFSTTKPLAASVKDSVLSMNGPMVATWKVDPAWGTEWLLGQPADAKAPPAAVLSQPTDVTISLFRLTVPLSGPMMKPGSFGFDASVDAPRVTIATGATTTAFENLKVRAQSGAGADGKAPPEPGTVGLSVRLDAPGGAPGSALNLAGGVYQLADAGGNLTTDAAVVTLRGRAEAFPTPVIDALAKQDGVLVEALGPTLSADIDATGLSSEGGTIDVTGRSPRASFNLRGGVRGGAFRAGAANGQLFEITKELGAKLVKGLPSLGTFEKQKEDGPAKVNASGLTLPIDGDMSKLNGDATLELGVVRFDTAGALSKLLRSGGGRQSGTAGRRLDPLKVSMKDGVVTYERYRVPLGEFTIESRGTVDLVRRTIDVVTYVPLGALSEEVAGVFNNGRFLGGKTLEAATMVPIRTRGPMDAPTSAPDVKLFFEEAGKSLLSPEGLKDLFGGG